MTLKWFDGAVIHVVPQGDGILLSANREGLLSLSAQFSALAECGEGFHYHLDPYNGLEEGSVELIIEKR